MRGEGEAEVGGRGGPEMARELAAAVAGGDVGRGERQNAPKTDLNNVVRMAVQQRLPEALRDVHVAQRHLLLVRQQEHAGAPHQRRGGQRVRLKCPQRAQSSLNVAETGRAQPAAARVLSF